MFERFDDTVVRLAAREQAVWLAAVAAYGVGDLATTTVGVVTDRATEAGPFASALLAEYGLLGIVGLKVVTVLGFYLLWRVAPRPGRVAAPLALATVGVAVTTWNLLALL